MIVHTYNSTAARNDALKFSAILAVDLGVSSEINQTNNGWDVVADDGKVVRFVNA